MLNLIYLNDQHQDEDKNESCVEVWDIEGCPQSPDQSVASNDSSQQHCSKFRAQVSHQAEIFSMLEMLIISTFRTVKNNLSNFQDMEFQSHLLRTAVPAIVRDIMTIRLVRKAKVQKTKWVPFPNLALITWSIAHFRKWVRTLKKVFLRRILMCK